MDSRRQLLQTLMDDLAAFKLPERYDEAQKAEIRRGRKGQAAIDAGREQIDRNEAQYQAALQRRADLQGQIATLQGEIDKADQTARANDPLNQAAQYGKSIGIPAAGYAAGHVAGAKFGQAFDVPAGERASATSRLAEQLRRIDKAAPTSRAQASAIVDTYDKANRGRGLAQFLGPAALAASSVATQQGAKYVDDPTLKEGLNLAANAERYGAAGMTLQQVFDTLRGNAQAQRGIDPTDVATIESARRQLNEGGRFDKVQGAFREAPAAPEAAPAKVDKPAPKVGTRADLYRQAKARDLPVTTRMKKAELESVLAKALRGAGKRAKDAPKAILPASVGLGVYDALRNPAEAGAATIGLAEGARRVGERAAQVPGLGAMLRGLGRVAGPAAAGLTAYDAGSAVLGGLAQGDDVAGADRELRQGNRPFMAQQDALRRMAYGEQPAAPGEADLAPIVASASEDPETAALLRELILDRIAAAQGEQIPTALASQAVAMQSAMR